MYRPGFVLDDGCMVLMHVNERQAAFAIARPKSDVLAWWRCGTVSPWGRLLFAYACQRIGASIGATDFNRNEE